MQRPLPEVMASQDEMLRRRGTFDPGEDNSVVARAFQDHLSDVYAGSTASLREGEPGAISRRAARTQSDGGGVAKFLELPLDVEAMTQQVDGTLVPAAPQVECECVVAGDSPACKPKQYLKRELQNPGALKREGWPLVRIFPGGN